MTSSSFRDPAKEVAENSFLAPVTFVKSSYFRISRARIKRMDGNMNKSLWDIHISLYGASYLLRNYYSKVTFEIHTRK
jgi:hypothetical protein